jgi:RNA polymerase sigma-32 factor
MSIYLDSIKNLEVLPNEQVVQLFADYNLNNNKKSRDKIINSTLRLVAKIASKYKHYGKFEDIVQEGNIGLLKAIDKFDLSVGVPWSTYSAQWIKAYILRFIFNNQTIVKRGTSTEERKYYWKLLRSRAKLNAQGLPSDAAALASEFGLTSEQVEFILSRSTTDSSLQSLSPNSKDEEDSSEDVLDNQSLNIEESLIKSMSNKDIEEKMNYFAENLSPQKRLIFVNRFMSDDYQTFAQLGEQLGVTRQRVQQIESDLKKQFMSQIKM